MGPTTSLSARPGTPAAAPSSRSRAREVIFTFDDVTWEAAQRRGMCFTTDRVALALLNDPRIDRLLICDQPRSAPIKLGKDLLRGPVTFEASERARLRQPLRLRRRDPVRLRPLARHYAAYGRRLQRAALRFGLERPAIVTAQPLIAGFADLEWAGPVTLLATDDWAAHPAYRRWWPAYEAAYERVAERRRRVCAVSQAILDRIEPLGQSRVVPNGVDPGEWLEPGPPPSWLARLPRPHLLYIGALDARLDVAAVLAVARAWPNGSVVLAGPMVDEGHLAPLLGEPNVVVHGPLTRREVAALASAADACLMPHLRSPLTDAMSPLKLYEYLAAGGPAVATDLEPVRRVEGPVVRVAPGGDFAAGVRAALESGPWGETERRRFIERNSWAERCEQVLALALAE